MGDEVFNVNKRNIQAHNKDPDTKSDQSFFSSSGSEYVRHRESEDYDTENNEPEENMKGRPKRGRKRKQSEQSRNTERRDQTNEQYVNTKGKTVL
jgi:hypothetical protein